MGQYRHNKSILLLYQTTSLIRTKTDNINEYKNKNMIPRLHEINGKLDMIQDLKLHDLKLSLDQQEKLLNIHQQLIDRRVELIKEIKKQYII
jgi:hypothetical protein